MVRAFLAIASVLAVAACSSGSTYQYMASAPVSAPALGVDNDAPIHHARAPSTSGAVSGPSAYNSDNRPVSVRTGLNSDPNNPSGVAGGGTI